MDVMEALRMLDMNEEVMLELAEMEGRRVVVLETTSEGL